MQFDSKRMKKIFYKSIYRNAAEYIQRPMYCYIEEKVF